MLLGTEERNPTHLIPPFEKHPNTVYIVFPSQLVPGLPSSSQLFGVLLVYFFLPIGLYKVHTFDIIMSLAGATEGQGSLTPSGGETSQNAARQQTVELIATSQSGLSVSTQPTKEAIMPNLTDNQAALIRYIVAAHKGGQTAKVSPLHGFHPATLKSLVARGLVRKLDTTAVHTPRGWINGQYRFQHSLVDEVELTRQGWDHVYGFKSQPTAVAA